MTEWADGRTGRTVTWPAPDAYVLVDGVLLRTVPEPPGLPPGTPVTVRRDRTRPLPVAREDTGAAAE
ncbi:hypothetical protein FRZ03_01435 [Streptomyces misionensis]|uniref:Uncharacterized protein n=2 Tax=Streptomyces misionensis TaxID=67331 RepID=A0A5C6K683_9ACTN|nr:hypothetical protein FRZ03_01435 [Streptomyces misionensis]